MSKTANTSKKPHRRKDARPTSPTALDTWANNPPFTPAYAPARVNEFRRTDPHYTLHHKNESDPRVFQQSILLKAVLTLIALALLIFALGIVVNWLLPNAAVEFSSTSAINSMTSLLSDV